MNRTFYGKAFDRLYIQGKELKRIIRRSRLAKKQLKAIGGGYKLTEQDKKELREYWKPYGVKPKKFWYRLYCASDNTFDPRYIPDTMWFGKIYPYFNNLYIENAFIDKSFYDTLFSNLKRPVTVVKNISGQFYTDNMELISRDEAIQRCSEVNSWIIKPSVRSGQGRDIAFYDKSDSNAEDKIAAIFDRFNINFIVQKIVKQHEDLAIIHKESLNTIRVQSFFFKGKVHILSARLRMGSGTSRLDNFGAGGFICNINSNGRLNEMAAKKNGEWSNELPSGIKFKDIIVPSYNRIIEIIKREHIRFPYFGIIGWDFAVDQEGDPVFIELNVRSEPNQIVSGPSLGNMTEEALRDLFIDKTMKDYFIY